MGGHGVNGFGLLRFSAGDIFVGPLAPVDIGGPTRGGGPDVRRFTAGHIVLASDDIDSNGTPAGLIKPAPYLRPHESLPSCRSRKASIRIFVEVMNPGDGPAIVEMAVYDTSEGSKGPNRFSLRLGWTRVRP